MHIFGFGVLMRKNKWDEKVNIGIFRLHAVSNWRITHKDSIFVGSSDIYYPSKPKEFKDKSFD